MTEQEERWTICPHCENLLGEPGSDCWRCGETLIEVVPASRIQELEEELAEAKREREDLEFQVRVLKGKRDLLNRRLADCKMWRWHMTTRLDELEGALKLLVDLKDGPRGAAFRRAMDEAWTKARYLIGKPDDG